jgi:hypothetical protein
MTSKGQKKEAWLVGYTDQKRRASHSDLITYKIFRTFRIGGFFIQ